MYLAQKFNCVTLAVLSSQCDLQKLRYRPLPSYHPCILFCQMAQASTKRGARSPIYRLDNPAELNFQAIEDAAATPQRGVWRYLTSLFESTLQRHSQQFSIESDATLWRLRYRRVHGYDEHIVEDPSLLVWAVDALQIELWGNEYHLKSNRSARFLWSVNSIDQAVSLNVLRTINGDVLHFDLEHLRPIPPQLEELGLTPAQLIELRLRLDEQHGMIMLTSPEPVMLNDFLLAINQDLISPDRKLLSIHDRHRYSVPRTIQIDLPSSDDAARCNTWQHALNTHYDTLLIRASVPEQFQQQIANNCDQGGLVVQAVQVKKAADFLRLLNASIIRHAPLHRSVTSVISHYPVRSICAHCSEQATLNEVEQQWLEQLRTPVTENVVGWLADGNRDQFRTAKGCEACSDSGEGKPLAVFDVVHRDESSYLFPNAGSVTPTGDEQINYLQRELMTLAKTGRITLNEVIRVLTAT